MSELRPWAGGVWIAEAPLRFYGIPFGTRMSVVRLSDGALLLHSPIALPPPLRAQIDALREVQHVVSPNKLHHLYLGAALAACPQARCELSVFAPQCQRWASGLCDRVQYRGVGIAQGSSYGSRSGDRRRRNRRRHLPEIRHGRRT